MNSNHNSILLVEDDIKLASLLQDYLQGHGFDISLADSGAQFRECIKQSVPDLIILDLNLPDVDGLTICRELRPDFNGKILMLTASGDDMDQVAALELGANDFVQKPVQPRVLLARIRNLLRQFKETASLATNNVETAEGTANKTVTELSFGPLKLSHTMQRCSIHDQAVPLTPSEFSLLWQLATEADQIQSRDSLLRALRNIDYDGIDRSIDNKISQLRKKLGDSSIKPEKIVTIRNKGYVFVSESW